MFVSAGQQDSGLTNGLRQVDLPQKFTGQTVFMSAQLKEIRDVLMSDFMNFLLSVAEGGESET